MFNRKTKQEIAALRAENARLNRYIEDKKSEEKAELERQKQMSDFWAYNGTPQEVKF